MAAPAYVQSASATASGAGTTVAKAYGSNVTVKSGLICYVYWNSNTQTCTVADNVNGAWVAVGSPLRGAGGLAAYSSQAFYKLNAAAGATTVTATMSGSNTDRAIAVHEVSTVNTLDSSGYANYNGASPILTASKTNGNPACYWFAGCVFGGSSSGTMGGGFTLRERTNFGNNETAEKVVAVSGAAQAQFNAAAPQDAMTVLVGLSQAAGGVFF